MLTLEELRADSSIDTVIMAFTDMQGRLLGKRLHRDFFFEQVDHGHGTEGQGKELPTSCCAHFRVPLPLICHVTSRICCSGHGATRALPGRLGAPHGRLTG